jgi:hypothetical protein
MSRVVVLTAAIYHNSRMDVRLKMRALFGMVISYRSLNLILTAPHGRSNTTRVELLQHEQRR